jgi:hypothetical protein
VPLDQDSPWLGGFTLVGSAVIYALLLAAVRRVDRAYPSTNPTESTWWFGYARDLTNLVGAGGFALGYYLLGFAAPRALICGVAIGLVVYGMDFLIARKIETPYATIVVALLTLAIVIPSAIFRAELDLALASMLTNLF